MDEIQLSILAKAVEERLTKLEANVAADGIILASILRQAPNKAQILEDAQYFLGGDWSMARQPFRDLVQSRVRRLIELHSKSDPEAGPELP